MATTLYLGSDAPGYIENHQRGFADSTLAGDTQNWLAARLDTNRGTSAAGTTRSTVAGTTSGIEVASNWEFISDPLSADATISGTVTFNLWMSESNMNANAGAQCVIDRLDNTLAYVSTVVNSEQGSELGTSGAGRNWTASPTSTSFSKGDRIRVRVAANDGGGTMASGHTVTLRYRGPTAGADGDSYVTFNEDLTFMTAAAGTVLYLTDSAGEVDPNGASYDSKDLWTSRGAGVTTSTTDTAAGPTAPLQLTASAGGNYVEWFTHQLTAFTLTDTVVCNLRGLETSGINEDAVFRAQIARVDSDGTNPSVFGESGQYRSELGLTERAETVMIAGPDVSISDGQRLRLRVYIDDSHETMASGGTCVLYYAGTSGGASGDSYITLSQSVSEYSPGGARRIIIV